MAGYAGLSLGAVGNVSYSGTLLPADDVYRLGGGGGTLTIAVEFVDSEEEDPRNVFINGDVVFAEENSYTGGTTITAGTLTYGTDDAIYTGGVTVAGGTLELNGHSDSVGAVTLTEGSISGGTLTSTGGFTVESGTIDAVLAGSASLTKVGNGTVTISSDNTYTGSTTISAGTVRIFYEDSLGIPTQPEDQDIVLGSSTDAGTLCFVGTVGTFYRGFVLNAGGGQLYGFDTALVLDALYPALVT